MQRTIGVFVALGLFLQAGCGPSKPHEEPTVDSFIGRLTANGKPVTFPAGQEVVLMLVYEKKAERFGIPIQPDGSFKIGWMPIGKYSAVLERPSSGATKGPSVSMYNVPGGLTIEAGKTEYTVDLGPDFKP